MEKTTRDTVQTLLSTKRNLCGPRIIRFIPLHSNRAAAARGGAEPEPSALHSPVKEVETGGEAELRVPVAHEWLGWRAPLLSTSR